jgi:hypothetical protein
MSIHRQITALLDGELVEAGAVAELMHVLAVSPEKQALLVEQLALKRHVATSASRVVPPAGADLAIMRGLGAIDAGFPSAGASTEIAAPAPVPVGGASAGWSRSTLAALAALLIVGSFAAGYLLRGGGATTVVESSAPTVVEVGREELASARDSIVALNARIASLASATPATSATVAETRATHAATSGSPAPRPVIVYRDRPTPAIERDARVAYAQTMRPERVPVAPTGRVAVREDVPVIETQESAFEGVGTSGPIGVQVGFRNHARLSLPRVYGLAPTGTVLLDREVIGSVELGDDGDGLLARLRAGVALGQTQFGMVFHTNTGGAAVDTIIEMSPQAFYGRAFIAPELVRFDALKGLLEVGGGYSEVGGFGTVGLNLEYRPYDQIAFHAGASTWLLWTEFNDAVDLSTNVNAHLGVMLGF